MRARLEKVAVCVLASVYQRYAVAALCGALVTLLFSPFEYILFLFPALSGLFLLLRAADSRRQSFMTGWWFGLGMYVSGLYWIANAMLVDAEQFGWMIPFVVIGMNGVLAIYSGLLGAVMWWIRSAPMKWQWLGFAIGWGALEGLRSVLFTGFPWNLLGYATVFSQSAMQLAHYVPIIGLSIGLVLLGSVPVLLADMKRNAALRVAILLIVMAGLGHSWGAGQVKRFNREAQERAETISAFHLQQMPVYAVLQGNVEQTIKSNPALRELQLKRYVDMMGQVRQERAEQLKESPLPERLRPLVFIWPETAFPYLLLEESHWLEFLPTTLRQGEAMVAGVMRGAHDEEGIMRYYNSVMVVQRGKPIRFYDKQHLVPFGEYVPFRDVLPMDKIVPGLSDFSAGENGNLMTRDAAGAMPSFISLICYEAIFGDMIDDAERNGAKLIVNVTNDGWFGDSIGPHQHLMMTRFRAVEQRLPVLRAANTGISAVIDARGKVNASISLNQKGAIFFSLK